MTEDSVDLWLRERPDHWRRFVFCIEQAGHAYLNLFVEAAKRYHVPKVIGKVVGMLIPVALALFIVDAVDCMLRGAG